MSDLLGLDKTIELIEQLKGAVQRGRTHAAGIEQEFQVNLTRLNRHTDQAIRVAEERLSAATSQADEWLRQAIAGVQSRQDHRKARLLEARQAAEGRGLKAIGNDEGRQVFDVQRQLLQVARDYETGRAQADAALATLQQDWTAERQAVESFERAMRRCFRGFRAVHRLLESPQAGSVPGSPASCASPSSRQLIEDCRALRLQAEQDLARFRRLPLCRLFALLSPWLLALLILGGHVAVFVVRFLRHGDVQAANWPGIAASLAGALVVFGLLHWIGKRLATTAAHGLGAVVGRMRVLHEGSEPGALAEHARELQRIKQDAAASTDRLEQLWNRAVEEAARRRQDLKTRLSAKLSRALARQDRLSRLAIERLEREHSARLEGLRLEARSERRRLEEERSGGRSGLESAREAAWQALIEDWARVTQTVFGGFEASRQAVCSLFPDWSTAVWQDWEPRREFVPAAPFAEMDVDVEQLGGGLPADPRLAFGGPTRFAHRLLLTFPDRGCLLLETLSAGRALAVSALNNLVLRLLLTAPPGRALFTILDPVGLGESFAGLMHLADHEDRLINRRIWTQAEQIEERLAELNEHVEKVTQLYLRNEYATIAEFNRQAGHIAEPYHYLVVADFPVNFSETAVKRLMSLTASGPRCGVFVLIHWDRRKPAAAEFAWDDLRKAGVHLGWKDHGFVLIHPPVENVALRIDPQPEPGLVKAMLQKVGQSSVDSNRVEMPFQAIVPDDTAFWSLDTTVELRVPIGVTGANKLQYLALGRGTRQHALVAGKTGSGKSTLFHVVVTNLALWCSPAAVEFYLVDFKKGVEFKCYATHQLPHARVVAIESDREFALSVLQRVDEELHRRGDLFRRAGAQDLPGYRRASGTERLPRILLLIDEFQEFFTEDDRVSQNAALLLDRLVRQGRAFGIHVLLGSQTLGGAYTLTRTTLGQMVVRIALQSNQADAMLIMDDDNLAPRLLSRPGEAIYNDAAGAVEGNSPFQVVWLPEDEREGWLAKVRHRAAAEPALPSAPVVFEGNAPAEVRDNAVLRALLQGPAREGVPAPRIFLGAPNAIKGPTEIAFHRQSGSNLLVVGQYDDPSLAILSLAMIALAAQHPPGSAQFVLLDASPDGSPYRAFLERTAAAIPHPLTLAGNANLDQTLECLGNELAARAGVERAGSAPALYFCVHHLQRFKRLRYEDDFAVSLDPTQPATNPGQWLNRILSEGTRLGLHVLCVCDTFNNASRFLSRRALSEFDFRVLFQMSASDSASLIDNPKAAALGLHRALLFNAREGTLETFRPYALPNPAWLDDAGRLLRRA